jgi:hypothetical protein
MVISFAKISPLHESFFQREFAQRSVERYGIKQIIYEPVREVIVQWIL